LKWILSTAFVLLSAAAIADSVELQPSADQLLRDVVSQMPTDPIHVTGELLVRKRRGVLLASLGFELQAHWGGKPASASYTVRDAFGHSLEQLTITYAPETSYRYATGDPLQEAPLGSLSQVIQDTDLSWMDLTLAFLWWPDGDVIGAENLRTFDCYIVEIMAPSAAANPAGPPDAAAAPLAPLTARPSPYARVRLWISKKSHLMLQAEGYAGDGTLMRRLWVQSCKKINDQWMIQDMEVQHYPAVHRTKLHVDDVEMDSDLP